MENLDEKLFEELFFCFDTPCALLGHKYTEVAHIYLLFFLYS